MRRGNSTRRLNRGGTWLGSAAPAQMIVIVEVVALAAFVIASIAGLEWQIAAAIGAGVLLVGVVSMSIRPGGTPVWTRIRRRSAFRARRRKSVESVPSAFDVGTRDGTTVGLRWHRQQLISVLRVSREPGVVTRLRPHTAESGGLAMSVIAKGLVQFDIELEEIDIVSHGWKTRSPEHIAATYGDLVAPLAAIGYRDTFVVMRFRPAASPEAVLSRGGGTEGMVRAATAAARRMVNRLAAEGLHAEALTAVDIESLSLTLGDGSNPVDGVETWSDMRWDGYHATCFALDDEYHPAVLHDIWNVPAVSVLTRTSIRPHSTNGDYSLRTIVRYGTTEPMSGAPHPALRLLVGIHRPAYDCTLPIHVPEIDIRPFVGSKLTMEQIFTPLNGCGQLVGADDDGNAVAVELFGSRVQRVEVWGDREMVQQIVLRAAVLGARVVIWTDRPAMWQPIVDAVADPFVVWVAGTAAPQADYPQMFDVAILDSPRVTHDPSVHTQIRLNRGLCNERWLPQGVDVMLIQDPDVASLMYVVTTNGRAAVTLVAGPKEKELYATGSDTDDAVDVGIGAHGGR
ncbi:MAG: type VII secretion protein EccE [Nocardiaceae bacterium]|nr:type VII secretion protein EccE [Nocardiaceae bacterium]